MIVGIVSISILLLHVLLTSNFAFKNQFNNVCQNNPFMCFISGIMNIKYYSMDHFSLIPYLGYFLLGSSLAFVLYRINVVQKELNEIDNKPVERKYKWLGYFDQYKDNPVVKIIGWIGKRSLLFYTTHFIILYCIFKIIQIHSMPEPISVPTVPANPVNPIKAN